MEPAIMSCAKKEVGLSWSELQETAPIEPANVLNGTMAAATNNLHNTITPAEIDHDWCAEVALSPIETIPADTDHDWAQEVIFEQDHDWATGFFPSFI
uniref:Homeodomain-like protein n=1 Tax=Tanacetum cinerariifolium TaxID=118510 RepID=A0A6L2KHH7_TANCI|nr:homeodomain-like protein [Tanacetum cinerariifolium]